MLDIIINERVTEFPQAELRKDSAEKGSQSSVGKCKPTFITEPTGKQPTTSCNESSPVINQDLKSTIG